jgi:hypothetical protein
MISIVGLLKPLFHVSVFQMFLNTKGFLSKKHALFNRKTAIGYSKLGVLCFRMFPFVSFMAFCTKLLYKYSNIKLQSSFLKIVCSAEKTNSSAERANSEVPEPNKKDENSLEKRKSPVSSNSSSEELDVTQLNYPGVYEILVRSKIKNDKSYYGQSNSLIRRLMHHHQGLMNETHECKPLVAAFKEQGKPIDKFRFIVHKSGPEWRNNNLCLKYESELIAQNEHRCYNTDGVVLRRGHKQHNPNKKLENY